MSVFLKNDFCRLENMSQDLPSSITDEDKYGDEYSRLSLAIKMNSFRKWLRVVSEPHVLGPHYIFTDFIVLSIPSFAWEIINVPLCLFYLCSSWQKGC